jgi:hypothetical protein
MKIMISKTELETVGVMWGDWGWNLDVVHEMAALQCEWLNGDKGFRRAAPGSLATQGVNLAGCFLLQIFYVEFKELFPSACTCKMEIKFNCVDNYLVV